LQSTLILNNNIIIIFKKFTIIINNIYTAQLVSNIRINILSSQLQAYGKQKNLRSISERLQVMSGARTNEKLFHT